MKVSESLINCNNNTMMTTNFVHFNYSLESFRFNWFFSWKTLFGFFFGGDGDRKQYYQSLNDSNVMDINNNDQLMTMCTEKKWIHCNLILELLQQWKLESKRSKKNRFFLLFHYILVYSRFFHWIRPEFYPF